MSKPKNSVKRSTKYEKTCSQSTYATSCAIRALQLVEPLERKSCFYYLVGDAADPAKWTRGKVSGSIKLSPQADKWSGPFKIIVLDQNGNTTFSADGKMSATRINVEH